MSFEVHAGEVVGFAGLVGAGRTDVGLALFGIAPAERGTIIVDGEPVSIRNPRDAMRLGIAYLSEDRRKLGPVDAPVGGVEHHAAARCAAIARRSACSTVAPRSGGRRVPRPAEDPHRRRCARRSATSPVATSRRRCSPSGSTPRHGARSSTSRPAGIDVGAKADVHQLIDDLARDGVAVIVISSDLPEVLAMSDRIVVMREGRVRGVFSHDEADPERVMAAAVAA